MNTEWILKAVETINAEIERLNIELQSMRSAANSYKMHYEKAQTEIEKLTLEIEEANRKSAIQALKESKENAKLFCEAINYIKSEAIKEFWERLKEEIRCEDDCGYHCHECHFECKDYVISGDNLVKEMTEVEVNQRRKMKRMIKRFIVWYLKRHNVTFEYNNYVVRMFSKGYYDKLMQSANDMRKEDEGK